jgi:hypothetical protein
MYRTQQGYESPPPPIYPQLSDRFLTNAIQVARKTVDMKYPNVEPDVKLNEMQKIIDSELKKFVNSHKAEFEVQDKINDMRVRASHAYTTVPRTTSFYSSSEHQNNVDAMSFTQSTPTPDHKEAAYALLSL